MESDSNLDVVNLDVARIPSQDSLNEGSNTHNPIDESNLRKTLQLLEGIVKDLEVLLDQRSIDISQPIGLGDSQRQDDTNTVGSLEWASLNQIILSDSSQEHGRTTQKQSSKPRYIDHERAVKYVSNGSSDFSFDSSSISSSAASSEAENGRRNKTHRPRRRAASDEQDVEQILHTLLKESQKNRGTSRRRNSDSMDRPLDGESLEVLSSLSSSSSSSSSPICSSESSVIPQYTPSRSRSGRKHNKQKQKQARKSKQVSPSQSKKVHHALPQPIFLPSKLLYQTFSVNPTTRIWRRHAMELVEKPSNTSMPRYSFMGEEADPDREDVAKGPS